MRLDSFGKKVVFSAATIGTLISGCKKEMVKYEEPTLEQKVSNSGSKKQALDCKVLSDADLGVDGKIIYRTPGMPNEKTVIGIKMIHPSKTYMDKKKLNQDIYKLHDEIVNVVGELLNKGLRNLGGEGLDYGRVDSDDLIGKGLGKSYYAFIKAEMKHGNNVDSFWIDDTNIRKKMLDMSHNGNPVEALKLNSKREGAMSNNLVKMLDYTKANCIAVIAGAEHFENNRDPLLKDMIGDENLVNKIEKSGINVILIEPASYVDINNRLNSLEPR
ncbi:hypothetical protein KKD70_01250 [Patescibacteria group bacterium]|nr:hypothetical protein [Patescibacteria group bacterium]